MTNDVVTKSNTALATAANLRSALRRTKDEMPIGGVDYLRFAKGDWTIGTDRKAVSGDSLWVVSPVHFQRGFICWSADGEMLGKVMRAIGSESVDPADLPDRAGGQWAPNYAARFKCAEGPQMGAEVEHENSSAGGAIFFKNLFDVVEKRLDEGEEEFIAPVVYLTTHTWMSKRYGKQIRPDFSLGGWANMDGVLEDDVSAGPFAEPVQATRQRVRVEPAAPVVKEEDAPEEDEAPEEAAAPVRRRRIVA